MKYRNIILGKFIDRPNRFIAHVDIDGCVKTVHVKNTGRCKELLLPEARVVLEKSDNPNRKTAYDLIAVYKEKLGKAKPSAVEILKAYKDEIIQSHKHKYNKTHCSIIKIIFKIIRFIFSS